MNNTDKKVDVVIKKDGKDLSPEEMTKLGLQVYKTENTASKPKTFKEFVTAFNTLIESYDPATADEDFDVDDIEIATKAFGDSDDDLLDELNQIYTPILVTQEIEGDISGPVTEACSSDNVLTEHNIIKFDNETKLAQLVGICSLLIARRKGSPEYKVFKKASEVKNHMKLQIQKKEHAAATALARKYLNKVASTSTSSVARKAAVNLNHGN
jgi:hypothetical protein